MTHISKDYFYLYTFINVTYYILKIFIKSNSKINN